MNRRVQSWSALLCLAAAGWSARPALAQYDPAKLPDPSRRWSVNAAVREEYDDNIFTSSTDKTASFKTSINPQVLANLPVTDSFAGFRASYVGTYYENRPGDQFDNEYVVDLLLSHSFSSRLVLNVNDEFRYAVEPALVDTQAGQPVEIRRNGNYLFNSLNGDLNFQVSRRWQLTVRGAWEHWDYQDNVVTTNLVSTPPGITTNVVNFSNDRNIYRGTLTMTYTVNPRTSVGANYQYENVDYAEPGLNSERNSQSHIIYATLVHQFSPQLSGQLNAGGEYRSFGSGNSDIGPFLDSSLSYAYAKSSAVSVGARYAITTTDISTYQSTDTVTVFGRVTHQFTPKLSGDFTTTFAWNSYQNPSVAGLADNVGERELSLSLNGHYQFTHWLSGEAGYAYDRVSSDLTTSNRDFDRNRVYLGARVTY